MDDLSRRRQFRIISADAPEEERLRVALHNARVTLEMLPPEDRGWLEYKIGQMRRRGPSRARRHTVMNHGAILRQSAAARFADFFVARTGTGSLLSCIVASGLA